MCMSHARAYSVARKGGEGEELVREGEGVIQDFEPSPASEQCGFSLSFSSSGIIRVLTAVTQGHYESQCHDVWVGKCLVSCEVR